MSGIKLRAGLLGLLAMLLLGSYAASPAFAAPAGPFCHHRNSIAEGNGELIKAQTPEIVAGKGGIQVLSGKVLGMEVKNEAQNVEVKGNLYNNALQCQTKVELVYNERSVSTPFAGCTFKVNRNNLVKLYGHKAWKYNEKEAELTEKTKILQKPDWIFIPVELQEGAKELPKATYATIIYQTIPGQKCSLNGTEIEVSGSVTARNVPVQLEEWSKAEEQNIEKGEGKQDFWNGTVFVPVTTALKFGEGAAYKGSIKSRNSGSPRGCSARSRLFRKLARNIQR